MSSPTRIRARGLAALGAFSALVPIVPEIALADQPLQYNRDIRPILSENCFACHGPDESHRKGKLRLDSFEGATADAASGFPAIVPGDGEESEVLWRIESEDDLDRMPPPDSGKELTPEQVAMLRAWIEQGGEYQDHWAYVTPTRPEVPEVEQADRVRNAIDAFILAGLEAKGIDPSPEADRATLIRRLSLDLTGLPPTPGEVEAFVNDEAPDAYDRLVDRLLDSPHYGERMAVPWLDVVRFSDTVGYHGDQNQRIFPYRDYVIDAFNQNKPFDQFTVEQLAGDLLPEPTTEQIVATGFNRLNMMTREGGAQPKEYLAKYAGDRVRTVSMAWLGSTLGCAECHDHKFDPFTAGDFYRLSAFFADVKQWGVYSEYQYTPNPDLRGYTNDHPFPPEIEVESPYLLRRIERLEGQIGEVVADSAERRRADAEDQATFEAWLESCRDALQEAPDGWISPEVAVVAKSEKEADGIAVQQQDDGRFLYTGKAKANDEQRFRLKPDLGPIVSIRLEVLPQEEHGGTITRNNSPSTTIRLTAAVRRASAEKDEPLGIWHADADAKDERYSNGFPILGVRDAWITASDRADQPQTSVWLLDRPITIEEGDEIVLTIRSDNVGCVRLSASPIAIEDPRHSAIDEETLLALATEPGACKPDQTDRLDALYLSSTGLDEQGLSQYRTLRREIFECRDGVALTLVTEAWEPATTRILPRGDWLNESGEVVEPGVPGFLPQPEAPEGGRLTRLDLANWLVSPDNPLTARAVMNRFWQQFFGHGISTVLDDLGAQGEWPSHPALLDWLAVEFRESGWDVKHMVRLLVTSATYRQDARLRPDVFEIDQENRLLASQSPRRLDAEFVRDNALAIAGLLNLDVGGPSAKPYQPGGYYSQLQFPDRNYVADNDDRQYRRGVYMHWQRTFLHPMLANFDAPSREECVALRLPANTPQQALTLLNDPTFVESARVLAQSLLKTSDGSDADRIEALYRRMLARPATSDESRSLQQFLAGQRSHFQSESEQAIELLRIGLAPLDEDIDKSELAAWTSVCRVVLNLHETITRY
ncbi:PSD1 and planctomycete cytochrome C domain-containing protein [soil metagenome]